MDNKLKLYGFNNLTNDTIIHRNNIGVKTQGASVTFLIAEGDMLPAPPIGLEQVLNSDTMVAHLDKRTQIDLAFAAKSTRVCSTDYSINLHNITVQEST